MTPTDLLILDDTTVRRVLTPALAQTAVSAALAEHSAGDLSQPRRAVVAAADGTGSLLVMPARSGSTGMAVKLISLFPGNAERGLPVITGLIALFDQATGAPFALLSGAAVTKLRTAAVSAVGTDLLTRADAHRLAVIGTGPQARAHLRALAGLRPWTSVVVAGRDPAKAEVLAQWARSEGLPASVAEVAAAVRGADTICTVTSATEPLFTADDVPPGRTDARAVTVFKSVGLALEDLATAVAAHGAAVDVGAGTTVGF